METSTLFSITGVSGAMRATTQLLESVGLENGQASKKKTKEKSDAQKLIPPKKGKGRRSAAEEQAILWIVAAAESFIGRGREDREEIPPVICLPLFAIRLDDRGNVLEIMDETERSSAPQQEEPEIVTPVPPAHDPELERAEDWVFAAGASFFAKEREEIPPVISTPCLDIKIEEKLPEAPKPPAPAFTSPPKAAPPQSKFGETIMGVHVTPLKPSHAPPPTPPTASVRGVHQEEDDEPPANLVGEPPEVKNGVKEKTNFPKAPEQSPPKPTEPKAPEPKTEPKPLPTKKSPPNKESKPKRDGSDLDDDLVEWMDIGYHKMIRMAGGKANQGRPFGYRLAQAAIGLDVMANGSKFVRKTFTHFAEALFALLDSAESMEDLDYVEYIMKAAVYLDMLSEIAHFQTKNGCLSVNLQEYYENEFFRITKAA